MEPSLFDDLRREFPVAEKYVYLDHAGIAPVSLRVTAAIDQFLREASEGGAFFYVEWATRVHAARKTCARLVNAGVDEIAFVRSTSHGLSLVAQGLDWRAGDNVVIYEKEFPANLFPWMQLRRRGVETRIVPSREGRVLIDDIERAIDSRTRLVAISSVQFTNGFRIDLKTLGSLCKERGVLFCVDAIQSLGVIPMDVKECRIDFLSADGHKWLLGPEGIGIFYCRSELAPRLEPALVGWKSVEREFQFENPDFRLKTTALRFEEGSFNMMGIFGLAAAIELLLSVGIPVIERRVLELGDLIIKLARERAYRIVTPLDRTARAGIVTLAGPFDPAAVRDALRSRGIMVNVRGGGLRISPHFYTRDEDIVHLFAALDEVAA